MARELIVRKWLKCRGPDADSSEIRETLNRWFGRTFCTAARGDVGVVRSFRDIFCRAMNTVTVVAVSEGVPDVAVAETLLFGEEVDRLGAVRLAGFFDVVDLFAGIGCLGTDGENGRSVHVFEKPVVWIAD